MVEKPLLKTSIPTFLLGNRLFGVYTDSYKAKTGETKTSLVLGEVVPCVDPADPLRVAGYRAAFGAQRIMGEPDAMGKFLKALASLK